MNLFKNTSFHCAIFGTIWNARMCLAAAMYAAAFRFLAATEAIRLSMVFCEIRGERIFQFWMPSFSAKSALHARSGCAVLADMNVAPTQANVVLSLVDG